ncbi:MAG: Rieske 2Fe-2S domain-containing protein [Ignavibacteria bacterium]|nr:Rieske 2Fe-2S domain-containing protein [Ignavibacteria bacterium]MBK7184913.1 Rieske 2Fe-2S domain-containing protein [Ignavibacteria bacterium]MBL0321630.1 Rieske 2Fe-2S domain-containing protein [Ignavibacteria bacterium]
MGSPSSQQVDRRTFLNVSLRSAGIGLCGLALTAIVASCESDSRIVAPAPTTGDKVDVDVTTIPELAIVGGAVRKAFAPYNNGQPVIIIRTGEATFAVFSAVCTHQGTLVNVPASGSDRIVCPRHEEEFLVTTGEPQTGTANSPLQRFTTSYNTSTSILRITF